MEIYLAEYVPHENKYKDMQPKSSCVRADHTHYIWEDSCFMILDLFSYVTLKMGEPRSGSVTCPSFTECGRCNKLKTFLDFFMEECYNWLSSCDTLAWAQQFSRHLSFFWVRPQDSVKATLG